MGSRAQPSPVVKDGAVTLKSYGVKRIGTEDRVGENTAFLIASCSKAYTAAAVALLVDEGSLGWDDKGSRGFARIHGLRPLDHAKSDNP